MYVNIAYNLESLGGMNLKQGHSGVKKVYAYDRFVDISQKVGHFGHFNYL